MALCSSYAVLNVFTVLLCCCYAVLSVFTVLLCCCYAVLVHCCVVSSVLERFYAVALLF